MKKKGTAIVFNSALLLILLLLFSSSSQAAFSSRAPEPKVKLDAKNNLTISWAKQSGLTGYKIYSCTAAGKNRVLIGLTAKNSFKVKRLKVGRTYYYIMRGYLKKNGQTTNTSYSKVLKVQVYRKSTLKEFLLTALKPVGSTMYVWGGGWSSDDTCAGPDAVTIGVSPQWKRFFKKQTSSYNYQNTRYQTRNGLDCSGYVGWCIYNILEEENGKPGYVMSAKDMSKNFASRGWGTYIPAGRVRNYRAGDIMSTPSGHVWIAVGQCGDGSVVLLHSSPPGVQLTGTPTPGGKTNSEAVILAKNYMKRFYPEWYKKFPKCSRGISYLTQYSQMRWDISGNVVMSDPDRYRDMDARQILRNLLKNK